jgi:uncharacterized protein
MTTRSATPWYREPWPWILMSGPAIVVVAGFYTLFLAWRGADPLVADDYYKQGVGINRTIAREERAHALGVSATVRFEAGRVHIVLSEAALDPQRVRLRLVHRTRAHEDRAVTAERVAPGTYEAAMEAPREGAWIVHIDDPAADWRVTGRWRAGEPSATLEGGGS